MAQGVAELLPRAQRELERELGLELRGPATAVLCGSTETFRRATPGIDHRHTLGVAFPERKVMFLNCQAIEQRANESLAITLRHELSHLIVGEVARRGHRRVPLWFDEGVAVWSSGKVALYDVRDFDRAVAAGALRPLADLEDRFPLDPVERGIAYEQSESFVRYVVHRDGPEAIRRILGEAAEGVDFEAAAEHATGVGLERLEAMWLDAIRPRWPWVSWLLNTVSLFGAMSFFAVFAFWIYLRRRRQKYEEWEAEESQFGEGDRRWR